MRLDIADMRLFVSIADAGSITAGAKRAHLALASASERLKNIERDAGVSLLVRHPRGISMTEAGELYVHHARQILSQRERMKTELSAFACGSRGKIKLYANTAANAEYLPRRLSSWLAEHPDIAIELEERTSVDIVNILVSGIGEAGIVSDAVDAVDLTLIPVADDRLVLITPLQHPLAEAGALSFSDVVTEPFVGLYSGNALQDHISQHAADLGHRLNYRIRMSGFEGFCEMVSNGIGVGILPASIADRFQHKFAFRQQALTEAWAKRKICLCYKHWASLSPAMRTLLTFLQKIES
ncbi:LysR family transcriptional regulator [Kluyvera genomosp. 1]|uniref:LysR family transcriptional regulator n=1 Tax=Kluyvera genomosp. 1 TaxID=2774053 RepID=UPI00068ED1A8|nr:LysR family transcriptional regulator [Kluyvera genomosp. 1]